MSNPYFNRTQSIRCPECGKPLLYAGRGRHECTNPECTVIYVTVSRIGKPMRTVTQGPTTFRGMDPFHSYAVKQEVK